MQSKPGATSPLNESKQFSDRDESASNASKLTKTGQKSFGRQATGNRADSNLLKRMGSNQGPSALFGHKESVDRH